jgi:hypothetical protein
MPPSEFLFSFDSEPKDPCILRQDSTFEHMRHDSSTVSRRNGVNNIPEPTNDVRPRNTVKLKREGHGLLREQVSWMRGWHDRIDLPLSPQGGQGKRDEKLLIDGRKKETVPLRATSAPCPTHALQERCDAPRGANLYYAVQIADIEAKLESRGRDNDTVRLLGEGALGLPPFIER